MINKLRQPAIYVLIASAAYYSTFFCSKVLASGRIDDSAESSQSQPTRTQLAGPPQDMEHRVVGGLSSVHSKDDKIMDFVNSLKTPIEEEMNIKIKSIDVHSYKTQIVSGTNYFVKVQLKPDEGDEQVAHLRIYKDFRVVEPVLSAVEKDKKLEDEIVYIAQQPRE